GRPRDRARRVSLARRARPRRSRRRRSRAMLNEDALLLIAAFGACALVVLGTLELLWPTRPRYARRRPLPVRDLSRQVPPRPAPARRPAPPARVAAPSPVEPPVARPV